MFATSCISRCRNLITQPRQKVFMKNAVSKNVQQRSHLVWQQILISYMYPNHTSHTNSSKRYSHKRSRDPTHQHVTFMRSSTQSILTIQCSIRIFRCIQCKWCIWAHNRLKLEEIIIRSSLVSACLIVGLTRFFFVLRYI